MNGQRIRGRLLTKTPEWFVLYPFEAVFSFISFIAGSYIFWNVITDRHVIAPSIQDLLPRWLVFVWSLAMALGGLLDTIGQHRAMPNEFRGMGLSLMASVSFVYDIVILVNLGWAGLPAGVTYLGFGLACAIRVTVLTFLNDVEAASRPRHEHH